MIAPRAQVVAELPGLGIRALSTAAFKLAELVALAQFIAGAECNSPSTRARARAREAIGNQRPWPADRVERWAIERLIPYAKNARTHTDAQIAAIAASIKEWGWTTPALVGEDGGLIASPLPRRARAARARGDAWRIKFDLEFCLM